MAPIFLPLVAQRLHADAERCRNKRHEMSGFCTPLKCQGRQDTCVWGTIITSKIELCQKTGNANFKLNCGQILGIFAVNSYWPIFLIIPSILLRSYKGLRLQFVIKLFIFLQEYEMKRKKLPNQCKTSNCCTYCDSWKHVI